MLCVLRIIAPEIIFGSLNLTNQVGNAFSQLISAKLQIAGSRPYFAKVDCDKNTEENRISKKLPALRKKLFLKIYLSYGKKKVFENINYTFEKNGKYALVGKSGKRKNNADKDYARTVRKLSRKIYYDGEEISSFDRNTYYEQMAYIEQDVYLLIAL